jgi:hypothetical protein
MERNTDPDDHLLRRVADETARELDEFCAASRLTYANERDHLAKCCKIAAARVVGILEQPPALSPNAFGDLHGWVGLGLVDVVLRWANRPPTFLELKCGAGERALRPCIWDAVKLSTAVLGRNASAGYLLAGARSSDWRAGVPGADLFESGEWDALGPNVRDRFLIDWRFWESEATPHVPGCVAAGFNTVALGSFPLTIAATPWELRLARVKPVADAWADWPSAL